MAGHGHGGPGEGHGHHGHGHHGHGHHGHGHHHEKHHGAHFFWEPPRLRKEEPEDEEEIHEDWLELTGDLILVACLFKLGTIVKSCGWHGLLFSIPVVLIIWRGLFGITQYVNAIDSDDITRLLALVASLLGIYLMVLNLDEGNGACVVYESYAWGFFIGFAISRFFLILLFSVAAYYNRSRFGYIIRWVLQMAIGIILAGFVTFSSVKGYADSDGDDGTTPYPKFQAMAESGPAPAPVYEDEKILVDPHSLGLTYIIITFLELFNYFEIWLFRWGVLTPPTMILIHIQHWVARRNIFLMVFIGESMLALLVGDLDAEGFKRSWRFQGIGFFICFGIALLNWNSQPHHIEDHVIRKNARRNLLQNYAYWLLNWPVFAVGVALKLQLYLLGDWASRNPSPAEDDFRDDFMAEGRRLAAKAKLNKDWTGLTTVGLLGHALAVTQFLLLIIDVAQRGERCWHTRQKKFKLLIRLLLALGHCSWYYYVRATGLFLYNDENDEDLINYGSYVHVALLTPAVMIDLELYKALSSVNGTASVAAGNSTPLTSSARMMERLG